MNRRRSVRAVRIGRVVLAAVTALEDAEVLLVHVTVMVEAKGFGPGLVNKYNARRVLDWVKNPRLPDIVELSTAAATGLEPGTTEQTGAPLEENAPVSEFPQD